MYLIPLYRLLDRNLAPVHAKNVLKDLLTCQGTCKMTREAFLADRDMQALNGLDLISWQAGSLVVTEKAYKLAGMNPATAVEVS